MIAKILLTLAVLIGIFLVVAAFQPAEFRVERSVTISSPAAAPFAQINDLHKWLEISPYAKLDPDTRYTFEGPPAGVGASMAWVGNSKVGEGRMKITEVRANELVIMRLDFIKPFASTAMVDFTFNAAGDQTIVTWSMAGQKVFVTKAMGLIMSMDKMLGAQFEEGLASLKTLSESTAKK